MARFGTPAQRLTPEKWDVDPDSGCWLWRGSKSRDGYGNFRWGPGEMVHAHRAMYRLLHGDIPAGMVVRHTCDTPACVNPEHLILGAQANNVADCVERGRRSPQRGEQNHAAKLNYASVSDIRSKYAAGGTSQQKLADEYGISQRAVSMIVRNQTWTQAAA